MLTFGLINTLPKPIEWLTDNGSCFIAKDTRSLLIDIGMEPCSTPVRSPQSTGMEQAFVKTFKRDYVSVNPLPDAITVIAQLPSWFEHYNTLYPHKTLGYRSPRELLNRQTETRSGPVFKGQLHYSAERDDVPYPCLSVQDWPT